MERNELKFILSVTQAEILKSRLRAVLKPDSNAPEGSYIVRSLYFDTPDHRFFEENLAGVGNRVKYRLRTYNGNPAPVRLERKEREYNLSRKTVRIITEKEAAPFIEGASLVPQLPELKPACICEYTRMAYVFPTSHVRITFDENICASFECAKFLSGDFLRIPVSAPGEVIMEIKFDDILPEFILGLIQIGSLRQASYSKFVNCCREIFHFM